MKISSNNNMGRGRSFNQHNKLPFLEAWPNGPLLCLGDVKTQVLEYQGILWLIHGIDLQRQHSRYPLFV